MLGLILVFFIFYFIFHFLVLFILHILVDMIHSDRKLFILAPLSSLIYRQKQLFVHYLQQITWHPSNKLGISKPDYWK